MGKVGRKCPCYYSGGGRHHRRIISRELFGVWEKSRGKKGLLWTHFRSGQSHVPPPSPPSFDEQGVKKKNSFFCLGRCFYVGIRCGTTPRVLFPRCPCFLSGVSSSCYYRRYSKRQKNKGKEEEEEEEGCLDHISGPVSLTRRRVFPFISFLFGK